MVRGLGQAFRVYLFYFSQVLLFFERLQGIRVYHFISFFKKGGQALGFTLFVNPPRKTFK
jgi:hypothetical protein